MLFLTETFRLGLRNLALHKLRSLLTVLGIIFGVCAVIVMVAIGEGNKLKILADIRGLGANNIILRSRKPPESTQAAGASSRSMLVRYGLTREDLQRLKTTVGPVRLMVPLKQVAQRVTLGDRRVEANVLGTLPELVEVTSQHIARGRYLATADQRDVASVAVLGSNIAEQLFPLVDPIGQVIRIDALRSTASFRVIGVLAPTGLAGGRGGALVGRNLNDDVHLPISTAQARYGDRLILRSSGSFRAENVELTELVLQVPQQEWVTMVADKVKLALDTRGPRNDVEVVVPIELLEQADRAQRNFNYLMTAIAALSLLVGGIGIMNIMLATVTERTREIGIRRALGATRRHIVWQFLVETTVLAGIGGVLGVLLGLGIFGLLNGTRHWFPERFTEIAQPVVTLWSVVLSFCVATTVGVVFGLYPAVRASRQDPIVALRHD